MGSPEFSHFPPSTPKKVGEEKEHQEVSPGKVKRLQDRWDSFLAKCELLSEMGQEIPPVLIKRGEKIVKDTFELYWEYPFDQSINDFHMSMISNWSTPPELISLIGEMQRVRTQEYREEERRKEREVLAGERKSELMEEGRSAYPDDRRKIEAFYSDEMPEILPQLREYSADFKKLWGLVYDGKKGSLPDRVSTRIGEEVFSRSLKNFGEWNDQMVAKGWVAHSMALYLQIFRNSEASSKIADLYGDLGPLGKLELERKLKRVVKNDDVFEFMFTLPTKPFIFDPRERPGNYVAERETNGGEPLWAVFNESGRLIFNGSYEVFERQEAVLFFGYDHRGRKVIGDHYYFGAQPNFRFWLYDKDGEKESYYFKNYLGLKGRTFYYDHDIEGRGEGSERTRELYDSWDEFPSFTDEQIQELWAFYGVEPNEQVRSRAGVE